MRGPKPFRIFLMGILALTPVAQAFWFAWAWRLIGAVAWPGPAPCWQPACQGAISIRDTACRNTRRPCGPARDLPSPNYRPRTSAHP